MLSEFGSCHSKSFILSKNFLNLFSSPSDDDSDSYLSSSIARSKLSIFTSFLVEMKELKPPCCRSKLRDVTTRGTPCGDHVVSPFGVKSTPLSNQVCKLRSAAIISSKYSSSFSNCTSAFCPISLADLLFPFLL